MWYVSTVSGSDAKISKMLASASSSEPMLIHSSANTSASDTNANVASLIRMSSTSASLTTSPPKKNDTPRSPWREKASGASRACSRLPHSLNSSSCSLRRARTELKPGSGRPNENCSRSMRERRVVLEKSPSVKSYRPSRSMRSMPLSQHGSASLWPANVVRPRAMLMRSRSVRSSWIGKKIGSGELGGLHVSPRFFHERQQKRSYSSVDVTTSCTSRANVSVSALNTSPPAPASKMTCMRNAL
mmetsp:Transcript_54482/g.133577  ORF Transcript_54482/g.133577 Transcript_54482/m.133577 type:complete len:244 (-) Transcript_54482:679-1410(-)